MEEVLRALHDLHNHCAETTCENCPLFVWVDEDELDFKECFVTSSRPEKWRIDFE